MKWSLNKTAGKCVTHALCDWDVTVQVHCPRFTLRSRQIILLPAYRSWFYSLFCPAPLTQFIAYYSCLHNCILTNLVNTIKDTGLRTYFKIRKLLSNQSRYFVQLKITAITHNHENNLKKVVESVKKHDLDTFLLKQQSIYLFKQLDLQWQKAWKKASLITITILKNTSFALILELIRNKISLISFSVTLVLFFGVMVIKINMI